MYFFKVKYDAFISNEIYCEIKALIWAPTRRFVGSFNATQNVSFRPPTTWKDMVLNKEFIGMMFRVSTSYQLL